MNERDFDALADAFMTHIEVALERSAEGCDFEAKPGGILEMEFDDGSKIIINKHRAAREIWIAARSGGFHFRPQDGAWIGTRDGRDLMQVLSACISDQMGRPVSLR